MRVGLVALITVASLWLLAVRTQALQTRKVKLSSSGNGIRITLYRHGKAMKLDSATSSGKALIAVCEEALMTSQGTLKVLVNEEMIASLKQENSLEIVYARAKTFRVGKPEAKVILDRLLIPLSGRFAEASATEAYVAVFCGKQSYDKGPFSNDARWHKRIENGLKAMGQTSR